MRLHGGTNTRVLVLLLATASKASAFADKSSLAGALSEWCDDAVGAEAVYGSIATWDVSAVTDMDRLIYDAPCKATFNEDIDAWDVSQVTTMWVRRSQSGGLRRRAAC